MARVFFNKVKRAAAYVGEYLKSYLRPSEGIRLGGLVETLGLGKLDLRPLLDSFLAGRLPDGRAVQNAGRNGADAAGRLPRRVYDMEVNLDKVFSVAFAICAKGREKLFEAATGALGALLHALEEKCAVARLGDGTFIEGRWFALAVPEYSNRNGEIHVHFHVLLFTALECADGTVRALDSRLLFQHTKWANTLLTAELAKRLNDLGLDATASSDGRLAIAGVPDALCERWSSRRREVVALMDERGLTTAKQSDWAAKASRKGKESTESLPDLLARHEREAKALGFDLVALEAQLFSRERRQALSVEHVERDLNAVIEEVKRSPEPTLSDIERRFAERAPGLHLGIAEILARAKKAALSLGVALDAHRRARASSKLEKALAALDGREGVSVKETLAQRAISGRGLAGDEIDAVYLLTSSGPALRVLEGDEGDRRHAVLGACADALRRSRIDCVFVTLRSDDAEALARETGAKAFSIARALAEWDRTTWAPFRERPVPGFQVIRTDKVQDTIGWALGAISGGELRRRAKEREREPLDLSRGPHVLVVERAEKLSKKLLAAVLTHAQRLRATVILSGSALASSAFQSIAATYQGASLATPSVERSLAEHGAAFRVPEAPRVLREPPPPPPPDLGVTR